MDEISLPNVLSQIPVRTVLLVGEKLEESGWGNNCSVRPFSCSSLLARSGFLSEYNIQESGLSGRLLQ